jgi:hypothetical protein
MLDISVEQKVAYVVIPGNKRGERIGLIRFGESGYYQTTWDHLETEEECKELVDYMNGKLGVPADVAHAMFVGSMFGWRVPGASGAVQFFSAHEV